MACDVTHTTTDQIISKGKIMSSIGGIGSNSSMMMQGMRGMKRPDPAEMAENLFSKLDTSGQGFIQKTDLQSAFDQISSSSKSSGTSSSVDDLFAQLDADSDGKVTKQEFSDTLKKLADQMDQQFESMRMQGAMAAGGMGGPGGAGGMPPPPPPQGGDQGFTKDELSSQLEEIGSTDSKRSSLISSVIENFDQADTDGNGKVSFQEAMAYEQSTRTSDATSQSGDSASASTSASASGNTNDTKVMLQIMKLMQAYSLGGQDQGTSSLLSVTA